MAWVVLSAEHSVGVLWLRTTVTGIFHRRFIAIADLLKKAPMRVRVELSNSLTPRGTHMLVHLAGVDALPPST